jgi:hypothetical protein
MIEESGPLVLDAVLPSQYWQRRTFSEPWHRLMFAVLTDALRCYQRSFRSGPTEDPEEFREVQEWFFSDDESGPFAYRVVCYALGIDADHLRDRMQRWSRERTGESSISNRILRIGQWGTVSF